MDNLFNSKRGKIARIILGTIALTGITVLAMTAPNIFQAFPKRIRRLHTKKALDQSLKKLLKRGCIRFAQGTNGWRIELTEKGRAELISFETRERLIKQGRWDGKWRILIFDIEEQRKNIREKVRRTLQNLGFYRLQDSVWVFPYECEEVLELLRTRYGVRHDALFVHANRISKDHWLRRHFKLPLE